MEIPPFPFCEVKKRKEEYRSALSMFRNTEYIKPFLRTLSARDDESCVADVPLSGFSRKQSLETGRKRER